MSILATPDKNPLKKSSILKKSTSISGQRSPSSKMVKFNSKVDVTQFNASPFEKHHEILVNSSHFHDENAVFSDEHLYKSTEQALQNKHRLLDDELALLEAEISRISAENAELSALIGFEGRRPSPVSEAEVQQLINQNKTLQGLLNAKYQENEALKGVNEVSWLENEVKRLEEANKGLERRLEELDMAVEREIQGIKGLERGGLLKGGLRKAVEEEIERIEGEIKAERLRGEAFVRGVGLEEYVLACAEFERLRWILEDKRKGNKEEMVGGEGGMRPDIGENIV